MAKNLVIVESPAKAKTINKILGPDFLVKSCMGHVRDLPVNNIGVDIEHAFKPKYVVVKGKQKLIQELKKAADASEHVFLAPDPDREGEAIAWHLKSLLDNGKRDDGVFFRVQFNEITPSAVRKAFEVPGQIDMNRVDAQQARRVLDRIVGYRVSPMLWQRIQRGLSAGRVQSVALRLVCEREAEIRAFNPEEFWLMGARVAKQVPPKDPFHVRLIHVDGEKLDIRSGTQVESIKSDLQGRRLRIGDIATKEVSKRASPPYITSTLQQAASSYFSFPPKRTMGLAQRLYEGVDLGGGPVGLITYMRTDSLTVAQDALRDCRALIESTYGPEYRPEQPNFFKNKASAQEAHEAIRPTDVTRTPDSLAGHLDPAELRLYRMIWQRFVSSQMAPAVIKQKTVRVDAAPLEGQERTYTFHATASEVVFPGYMKVTGIDLKDGKEKEESADEDATGLPELTVGENLDCLEWLADRKETKPPARFSEASLIRALENNGVGRPSTYAQTISTLVDRAYVVVEKRSLLPTDLGMKVSTLLVSTLEQLFNVKFTAQMEESLDEVEKGSVQWQKMLQDFYTQFEQWLGAIEGVSGDKEFALRVIEAFATVTEWGPETKRGKRTYSDQKFIESVHKQISDEKKGISQRQVEALIRIAGRYRQQAPALDTVINGTAFEALLNAPVAEIKPPDESDLRRMEQVKEAKLSPWATKFVDSIRKRIDGGRGLSPAQSNALDRILGIAPAHEDQKELTPEEQAERERQGAGIKLLVEAVSAVKEWKPPVKRGKMTFDDKSFYDSLSEQFGRKGTLSEKQIGAFKKLAKRYKDQIPGFEALAETVGIDLTTRTRAEH